MVQKSNYIIYGLIAVLLVIIVVSVSQLFNANGANEILKNANKALTEEQNALQDIIETKDDEIEDISKERDIIQKRRVERDGTIVNINKTYEENITNIASDDAHTDFSEINSIFRQHDSSN